MITYIQCEHIWVKVDFSSIHSSGHYIYVHTYIYIYIWLAV